MSIVTLSPKYQIVIPKDIRNNLNLQPGEKIQVIQYGNRIEYIPLKSLKKMRGFLKGIDTNIERENDRL